MRERGLDSRLCFDHFACQLTRRRPHSKESQLAKEHLKKKESQQQKEHPDKGASQKPARNSRPNDTTSSGASNSVLPPDLSPLHPERPGDARKCRCTSVYDGDTLTLSDGAKVRLLGIDTPEIGEPFASEAKGHTTRHCGDEDVWLEFQETGGPGNEKNKDRYGRLLAFVWVAVPVRGPSTGRAGKRRQQWLCVNEGLVAAGLAHAYQPSNSTKVRNREKLLGLQDFARRRELGQWSAFMDHDVLVTPSGSAFHKCRERGSTESNCKFLRRSKNLCVISASEGFNRGLHPCRNCL